jgi:Xaa-Pro aminopeptidase
MLLNVPRATEVMRRRGLDALVATTPDNVLYASGRAFRMSNWSTHTFAVIAPQRTDRCVLIIPTVRLVLLAQQSLDNLDVVTFGDFFMEQTAEIADPGTAPDVAAFRHLLADARTHGTAQEALLSVLAELGLSDARIGVDEMRIAPTVYSGLEEALPSGHVLPAYGVFREIRLVKTPEEVRRLQRAAEIVEMGEAAVTKAVAAGVEEQALADVFIHQIVGAKATPGGATVGSGPRSALPVIETYPRQLRDGDLVRYDLSCHVDGYFADTGRTVVVGNPSDQQQAVYEALKAGWDHLFGSIRAGARPCDLFEGAMNVVRASGIPHYRRQHLGHAIGLEAYDDLLIAPHETRPLEPGMVLNIEVPYYDLGLGGFQIEDTLELTADGPRLLTHEPRELIRR